ncbi:DMT family transporter [Limoniibacter endophyticus]|uniref:RhaT family transporter n=1 Tax=Limoniibacter endophyticus TaxID=1565040 RepID=A0A8J3DSI9_9HYPH|nr:DMT family transporter [Limoniibacter endophyticus]GHC72490.1 RhaT family transporter [Limoniibacter endophyticus]
MAIESNARKGMILMTATCLVFATQDGVSRFLAESVSVYMIVMLRFWFFGLLAIMWALRNKGGFSFATRTRFPKLQILRGVLLISEICLIMISFVTLGLIATHAVFSCYPLIVTALSVPLLGEQVGWRRWLAILVGFAGVLVIINPGTDVFSPLVLLPFGSAILFATYTLLTRYVAREDGASVSFFWTGIVGAVVSTPMGLLHWQAVEMQTGFMLAGLCVFAILGNWLLIKTYEVADASSVQPFSYMNLPFVSMIGLFVFGETLALNVMIGAAIVVGSGLFTLWRERVRKPA